MDLLLELLQHTHTHSHQIKKFPKKSKTTNFVPIESNIYFSKKLLLRKRMPSIEMPHWLAEFKIPVDVFLIPCENKSLHRYEDWLNID